MTTLNVTPLDEAALPAPAVLVGEGPSRIELAVHDASRLAWHVTVPFPEARRAAYSFELELEVPANLSGTIDPWPALQSNARLDGTDDGGESRERSLPAFRRAVVVASSKLARARDGFVRHCTLIRSSALVEDNHWRPLLLWLAAASAELANTRRSLLPGMADKRERALADEFLSVQLWTVLTDCGRALLDTRRALEDRDRPETSSFDAIEAALARGLKEEIAYRREAAMAEPVNALQLERLLARTRWLKKHFERVLFLDVESYQVVSRLSGWFSALAAMLAYLWFLLWQFALERHPAGIGSGVAAVAMITALAYASRERLKEIGRNWLSGRVQRLFAQRVTRYRLPGKPRSRSTVVVASARESFSQSSEHKPDPECGVTHDVTLLRFAHRGAVFTPPRIDGTTARQVRFVYRLDLSALFPRLHDAVRGFASLDPRTGAIVIVDVPRNYELPLRASLRWHGGDDEAVRTLVLNKNGLLRIDEPRK